MTTPRQMFAHSLIALKGWLPGNMGALDNSAQLSANVTIDPVFAGRVVHQTDAGEYEMGCTGTQMAIFLLQNSDDPDVSNNDGVSQAVNPDGTMSGLVATGGYEVTSTEFDDDQTYAVNNQLRAVASNSNATTGGRLTNQGITVGTNAVCGVVSKLPYSNSDGVRVIQFWPVYCPGSGA